MLELYLTVGLQLLLIRDLGIMFVIVMGKQILLIEGYTVSSSREAFTDWFLVRVLLYRMVCCKTATYIKVTNPTFLR